MNLFPSTEIGLFGRRQPHERGHRTPVTIVSHNAGSPQDRDTAVVIDVFGADEAPLGPCQCCTVRVQLQAALRALSAKRARRPFTRVAIHTDADPRPIFRTLFSERALGCEFHLEDDPPAAAFSGEDTDRFVLTEDAPLSWEAFSRFITTLQSLRGPDLLYAKGMLNVVGCRGPVVVRFMQHLAQRPVELEMWPEGKRMSRVSFVTRGVTETTVRDLFDAVRRIA